MNFYEFTFVAQQGLLQQEVEGMLQELVILLKNIKRDILFQGVKGFLENKKLTKQKLEICSKTIQESLIHYSDFLENFVKILFIELEENFSNLKEIKLKIGKELKNELKNLEIVQNFIRTLESGKQITKNNFIRNIVSTLKVSISENLAKIFQDILKDCEAINLDELDKILKVLLENVVALGLIKYEYWGLLDFAYPINKMKSGHYCIMCISSTSGIMEEFIRRIKLNENIIRHLFIQVNKFFEGKSYMINKQVEEQSA
ncbi:30S ribosomal protein S6 [Wolbachia endosymbiont of Dipetalonema caudispina]|nr:30S ribosomal protein S6 [Wolbachia endosymbiont of Dipetalonema caudispina]QKX01085.1 30S ribosomal protein S6 [Wolbachia endosymbiont of Dipetalonema caudispina]